MKILTDTELKAEAKRLISTGQMPCLDKLLAVISEVRLEYHAKIRYERIGKKPTVVQ